MMTEQELEEYITRQLEEDTRQRMGQFSVQPEKRTKSAAPFDDAAISENDEQS